MALQGHSQAISTEDRVRVVINQQGDTLVEMHYEDAKILLEDVLHYEYADSLLTELRTRDSLNTEKITLQKEQIDVIAQKNLNLAGIVNNFNGIVENKDEELKLKDETIKNLKKEVRKQKSLKVIGFIAAVILPILVLLA